jgi:DNA mismatch repair protein MLH1
LKNFQHSTKPPFSEELFYQIILQEFENFGQLKLSRPLSIKDCVLIAIEMEKEKGNLPEEIQDAQEIAQSITTTITDRRDMLLEYFSMEISQGGQLVSLPLILRGYIPSMDKLPLFLLRLGTEVDWFHEQNCFESFSRELAIFYSLDPPINLLVHDDYIDKVEHIIFPSFKTHFFAPTKLKQYVTQLANLNDLYKIFERC